MTESNRADKDIWGRVNRPENTITVVLISPWLMASGNASSGRISALVLSFVKMNRFARGAERRKPREQRVCECVRRKESKREG